MNTMEIRDWILISSAIIVVTGWFATGYQNRKNEISKKRQEYRLEALHSILPVFFSIQKHENPFVDDPSLLKNLEKARSNILMYGYVDEIKLFESFVKSIEAKDVKSMYENLQKLMNLTRGRIRKELEIST